MELLIKSSPKLDRVEIARSFSFKLNLGNYQSADFFCSQKSECAAEDAEQASETLYAFRKKQVMKSVSDFQIDLARKEAMQAQRRTA